MSFNHSPIPVLSPAPIPMSGNQLSAMSAEQVTRWDRWQAENAADSRRSGLQAQWFAGAMLASSFAYVVYQVMAVVR